MGRCWAPTDPGNWILPGAGIGFIPCAPFHSSHWSYRRWSACYFHGSCRCSVYPDFPVQRWMDSNWYVCIFRDKHTKALISIVNPLSISHIQTNTEGVTCVFNGIDHSVTTVIGTQLVDVGPPQTQVSGSCAWGSLRKGGRKWYWKSCVQRKTRKAKKNNGLCDSIVWIFPDCVEGISS